MQRVAWTVLVAGAAVFWGSCESPGEKPDEPVPVAVVFESDFLDVYGTIVVELDGNQLEVDSTNPGDCAKPMARAVPGMEFRASSARGFFWTGNVPAASGGVPCVTVPLDADGLKSGISGVFQNDPACLPAEVLATYRWEGSGEEELIVGNILSPWSYDPIEFDPPPWVDPTRFLLQMARLGRLVVVGGGVPSPDPEYVDFIWLRRRSTVEGCRQMNWNVPASQEGQRILWGHDPRDGLGEGGDD